MNIAQLSPVFGAQIDDVDLSTIDDDDFEKVYSAWVEYDLENVGGRPHNRGELTHDGRGLVHMGNIGCEQHASGAAS